MYTLRLKIQIKIMIFFNFLYIHTPCNARRQQYINPENTDFQSEVLFL